MGIKEIYYQWQQERHERKLKELEKMVEKEKMILKRIEASGYGKQKLLRAPKLTPRQLLEMTSSPKLNKQDSKLKTHENAKSLMSVKCRTVTDPELYLDSQFDSRSNPTIYIPEHLNVGVYSRIDTRTPKQVIDNRNNIYAQSTAQLRSDIYSHPGSMSFSELSETNPYSLCVGTAGFFEGKPLEYLEVSRGDGSKFYIAERFSKNSLANTYGLKEYSIKRYNSKLKCYEHDIIFSEGIDLARMIDNDSAYISMVGNRLLSEDRLQKCLARPTTVRNIEQRTDILHGAGYVGFLDANTLKKKSEFRNFDSLQAEREKLAAYQKSFSPPCNENQILRQMHPEEYRRISIKKDNFNHDISNDEIES